MADFTLRATAGTEKRRWSDPASETKPSRITVIGSPPLYHRCRISVPVTIAASAVDGSWGEGALDGLLGGRLFSWWFAGQPTTGAPIFFSPAGNSSVLIFTPVGEGSMLLVAARANGLVSGEMSGGRVALHLRCE